MSISNGELVSNFVDGIESYKSANNMSFIDRLDYRVLYSYSTPIALFDKNSKRFLISKIGFSSTTRKQKSILYKCLGYCFLSVHDVRIDLITNCIILYDEIIEEKNKLTRKRLDHTIQIQKNYINNLIDNLQDLIKYQKIDRRLSIVKNSLKLEKDI